MELGEGFEVGVWDSDHELDGCVSKCFEDLGVGVVDSDVFDVVLFYQLDYFGWCRKVVGASSVTNSDLATVATVCKKKKKTESIVFLFRPNLSVFQELQLCISSSSTVDYKKIM